MLFSLVFLAPQHDLHLRPHPALQLASTTNKNHFDLKNPQQNLPSSPFALIITKQQRNNIDNNGEKLNCFAVVVSNEEYLDGTLVLGYSLLKHSQLAQTGKAELVVIVPENALSQDSIDRLLLAGWTHVFQVEDLAKKAPKAHWAGTFNKLYLFNLTQYALVAFFDADMLMQHNPDYIFRTKLKDYQHIGALGNSLYDHNGKPRAAYFQTGMMLLIPAQQAFSAMMDDFYHGKDSRGLNGRDGLIIRRYFDSNYVNLDDALSAHVGVTNDYDWVTGLHFRGGFKPWFNRLKAPAYDEQEIHRLKKKGKTDFGPPGKWLEIGTVYSLWWDTYEEFHEKKLMERDEKLLSSAQKTGMEDAPEGYNPKLHLWMNRHSKKKSYLQYRRVVAREKRQEELDQSIFSVYGSHEVIVGKPGENCDDTCRAILPESICMDDALASPKYLQSCNVVLEHFAAECGNGAKTTKTENDGEGTRCNRGRGAPNNFQPDSSSCTYNNMFNPFTPPLCNATASGVKRLCLCFRKTFNKQTDPHENSTTTTKNKANAASSSSSSTEPPTSVKNAQREDDSDTSEEQGVCFVSAAHPLEVKKECIHRLLDSRHLGSWQIMESNKKTKKLTSLLVVRSRHHDGFSEEMWFPQPKSKPALIPNILLAHLVGRVLGFHWVPPTALLHLPLKTASKDLINKLRLKKHKKRHQRHRQENEESEDEEKKYLEEIVQELTPANPINKDVVILTRKKENRPHRKKHHHQKQVDEDGETTDWFVRVAVAAVQSAKNSKPISVDLKNQTEFAQFKLLEFLLGVVGVEDEAKEMNPDESFWWWWTTRIVDHLDEFDVKSGQTVQQIPRCTVLSKLPKQVLFASEAGKKSRLEILQQVLKILSEVVVNNNNDEDSFVDILKHEAGIDPYSWGFVAPKSENGKEHRDESDLAVDESILKVVSTSSSSTTFIQNLINRVESVLSLLTRCVL